MAQVIAGTSVSCLFADTPPSADSAAHHHPSPHMTHGYGNAPHGIPPHLAARQSYSPYGPAPQRTGYPMPRRGIHKRDEIILTMDDKVVGLRRAHPVRSDAPSVYNSAPSYTTLPPR